jgi:hypothetical protein
LLQTPQGYFGRIEEGAEAGNGSTGHWRGGGEGRQS